MNIQDTAEICHEANRIYCRIGGDNTQKEWENAEKWQRESAIRGVLFTRDNPTAGDSAQHDAWMKDKLADGWRYDKMKDPTNKTHPCLVEFNKLPAFQQKKDKLFRAIAGALL